jgi:putative tryptophan/tyrosine transport system substrate-binding protein
MRRRAFIALLGGGALAWTPATHAQQAERVRRVAMLTTPSDELDNSDAPSKVFAEALAKLGWIAGRTVTIERRFSGSGDDRLARANAADVVAAAPDVIVCPGTQVTTILQQQTRTIPIVFVNVADPVGSGLVASFAHPGGNITGFTNMEASFAGKWLGLLKDIATSVSKVLVLYDPGNPNWRRYLPPLEAAAQALGVVSIAATQVADIGEIARYIEAFAREPGAGMVVLPSGLMVANRDTIPRLAAQHRLPAMYPVKFFAVSGGLVAYGSEYNEPYERAAQYVDLILRGTKPSDLPVQAPTKFELVINLKTAKALGLTIPASLLATADEVIE